VVAAIHGHTLVLANLAEVAAVAQETRHILPMGGELLNQINPDCLEDLVTDTREVLVVQLLATLVVVVVVVLVAPE
jgi:hypothetical protein